MPTIKQDDAVAVIQRQSVAAQVYADLRNRILTGQVPQGERIVEATVARELGVSRAPVREAVNRLTEAGLLENRTHFGPSVVQMSIEKIRKLYVVRNAIEAVAIRAVALRHSRADIDELRKYVDEMETFAEQGGLAGLVDTELRFHEALWRMSENPYVGKVAGLLFDQMRLALTIDNAHYGNLVDVAREHIPLIEAIESGDPDRAERAMVIHVMASLDSHAQS